jgi:hypothetical protein
VQVGSAPLMADESAKARFFAIAPVPADFRGTWPPEPGLLITRPSVLRRDGRDLAHRQGLDDGSHGAHLAKSTRSNRVQPQTLVFAGCRERS